jgi:hypothetical protein
VNLPGPRWPTAAIDPCSKVLPPYRRPDRRSRLNQELGQAAAGAHRRREFNLVNPRGFTWPEVWPSGKYERLQEANDLMSLIISLIGIERAGARIHCAHTVALNLRGMP